MERSADQFAFSSHELMLMSNALNEVLHGPDAIEEWECHTRMGGTRADAEALVQRIRIERDQRPASK